MANTTVIAAMVMVTPLMPTSRVARNRAGSVTMSPAAVTRGAATLSMSQPRRTASQATPRVRASTTIELRTPPTTEITRKSTVEMVSATPKAVATTLASTASAAEMNRVRAIDATTFCPTTVSVRRDRRNVPVWMEVPRRLPSAPKMLPRMPMAAGTSTSRPGSASSVWVMAPRVTPASRSPPEETSSAASAWRSPAASEPTASRRRATKLWSGRESTGTRRFRGWT